jgi:hypothetical protein
MEAPQVGVDPTCTKRTNHALMELSTSVSPDGLLKLEISFPYKRNPPRCQRTTVSGVTTRRDSCIRTGVDERRPTRGCRARPAEPSQSNALYISEGRKASTLVPRSRRALGDESGFRWSG